MSHEGLAFLLCASLSGAVAGADADKQCTGAAEAVVEATIADLQRRIRVGELTCERIVRAYLTRISAYDDAKGLNAITAIAGDAVDRAVEADRQLSRVGVQLPLFCVPVVIKDNIDSATMPTTAGSVVLRDSVPPADAPVVHALRAAGAIILAKTNMAEWAFSPRRTISSTSGETANAYALDRVPAGSSGGTASAIAASFALVGLGSDTGNSIRGPSSHLALVGMRPTYGLVSLNGVIPLLFDRDAVGPMTRTVEDNARVLSVIATTADGRDTDYVAQLSKQSLRGARIGVLRALAQSNSMHPQIAQLFAQAIDDLRNAGAAVVDIEIDAFAAHVENGDYCPRFRADVNAYLSTLGPRAPIADVAEVFRQGRFAPESREQFEFFVNLDEQGRPRDAQCPPFEQQASRQAFRKSVVKAMDHSRLAALIYPTWTFPPALRSRAVEDYRGDNSQLIAPATGLPAITVPMGYTSGTLPVGLQLLGRPWSEGQLYALASGYERLTRHRKAPVLFPPLRDARVCVVE